MNELAASDIGQKIEVWTAEWNSLSIESEIKCGIFMEYAPGY